MLDALQCVRVSHLRVQHTFEGLPKTIPGVPQDKSAHFQSDDCCLFYVPADGKGPAAPLARELALALAPGGDGATVASGFKDVLQAANAGALDDILDDLGYPRVRDFQRDGQVVEGEVVGSGAMCRPTLTSFINTAL